MNEPADYRQQEENEQEFLEYLAETSKWFKEINKNFNEQFLGGKNDGFHDIEED